MLLRNDWPTSGMCMYGVLVTFVTVKNFYRLIRENGKVKVSPFPFLCGKVS